MSETGNSLAKTFWIDGFKVDIGGLTLHTPAGEVVLEPKVMQVLVVLASRPGEVISRQDLIDDVWAVTHGGDESLTRAISVLRKSLGDTHGRRTVIETVPRRGYRLVAPVSETGPVETSPQAASPPPEETVPSAEPIATDAPASDRRPVFLVAAAALAILAVLGGIFLFRSSPQEEQTLSVSIPVERVWVAPFEMGEDEAGLGGFANGLRSTLSSVFLANGVVATFEEGAGETTQKFTLTGEIDDQDTNVLVNIRLIDQRSQLIVWSQSFQRPADRLNDFADEIAGMTATVTRCILDMRPDPQRADMLPLYARLCSGPGWEDTPFPMPYTQPILEADPEGQNAKLWHAYALGMEALWENAISAEEKAQLRAEADQLIASVIAEDPDSGFAHFLEGFTMPLIGNWAAVEAEFLEGTARGSVPDPVLYQYLAFLAMVGRWHAGASVAEDMLARNPANYDARIVIAGLWAAGGEDSKAKREYAVAKRYDPYNGKADYFPAQDDLFYGSPEQGLAAIEALESNTIERKWVASSNDFDCARAFIVARQADVPDLDGLEATCSQTRTSWRVRMFTALGDLDRAFAHADEWDTNVTGHTRVLFFPDLAPFRRDARFWTLAEKAGLVSYWRDTGRWPTFCEFDRPRIDCEARAEALLGGQAKTSAAAGDN